MPEPTIRREPDGAPAARRIPAAALRDRVVRHAFSEGLVTQDEVARAWDNFSTSDMSGGARFWRFLAERQRSGREAVYALAARIYGFDEVGISVSDVIPFVRQVKDRFSPEEWDTMSRLRILPVGVERDESSGSERIVFACSDPTRLQVNSFLSKLSARSFILHYAAGTSVDYVIDRVLPVLFSSDAGKSARIGKPAARLVPLDPLRDMLKERGGYRRAA